MSEPELVNLYWTSSGPVEIHAGREWSLFPWPQRCAQTARAGFAGIGLWHSDVTHQLESTTLEEMRKPFDDAGLRYLEVEFLADFWMAPGRHLMAYNIVRIRSPARSERAWTVPR